MVREWMITALTAAVVTFATFPTVALAGWYGPWPGSQCYRWAYGWRYPYHSVMRHFAPPGCWHSYPTTTPAGVVWRSDYICK